MLLLGQISPILANNILRSDARHRRHRIVFAAASSQASVDDLLTLVVAKDLAARRLGRVRVDVGVRVEEVVDNLLVHGALTGPLAILVILLLAVRKVPHRGVNEHVAGPAVPVNHGIDASLAVGRNVAEVGDTPNVLAQSRLRSMSQQHAINERHERRALAPNRLFSLSEVGDRVVIPVMALMMVPSPRQNADRVSPSLGILRSQIVWP